MAVFEDKFRPDMEVCKLLQFLSFRYFPSCVSNSYKLILLQSLHNTVISWAVFGTGLLRRPTPWENILCGGPVVLSLRLEGPVLFSFSLVWALSGFLQCRIFSCVLRFLCQDTRKTCFSVLSLKIEQLCMSFMSHRPDLKMGQFLKSLWTFQSLAEWGQNCAHSQDVLDLMSQMYL